MTDQEYWNTHSAVVGRIIDTRIGGNEFIVVFKPLEVIIGKVSMDQHSEVRMRNYYLEDKEDKFEKDRLFVALLDNTDDAHVFRISAEIGVRGPLVGLKYFDIIDSANSVEVSRAKSIIEIASAEDIVTQLRIAGITLFQTHDSILKERCVQLFYRLASKARTAAEASNHVSKNACESKKHPYSVRLTACRSFIGSRNEMAEVLRGFVKEMLARKDELNEGELSVLKRAEEELRSLEAEEKETNWNYEQ